MSLSVQMRMMTLLMLTECALGEESDLCHPTSSGASDSEWVTPEGMMPTTCGGMKMMAGISGKPDRSKCDSKPAMMMGKSVKEALGKVAEKCCPGGKSACDDSLFSGPSPPPPVVESFLCHPTSSGAADDTWAQPEGMLPTTCGGMKRTTQIDRKPDRSKCDSSPSMMMGRTVKDALGRVAETCCPGGKSACDDSIFSSPAPPPPPPPPTYQGSLCDPTSSAAPDNTWVEPDGMIPTTCGGMKFTTTLDKNKPDRSRCATTPVMLSGKSVQEALGLVEETCCPGGRSVCDESLLSGAAPTPPPPAPAPAPAGEQSNLCDPSVSAAPGSTHVHPSGLMPTTCDGLALGAGISERPGRSKCTSRPPVLAGKSVKDILGEVKGVCCLGGKSACDDFANAAPAPPPAPPPASGGKESNLCHPTSVGADGWTWVQAGMMPTTCDGLAMMTGLSGKPDRDQCYSKPMMMMGRSVKDALDDVADKCCPGGISACDNSLFSGPAPPPPPKEESFLCSPTSEGAPGSTWVQAGLLPSTCSSVASMTGIDKPPSKNKCACKPMALMGQSVKETLAKVAEKCCPGAKSACDDSLFSESAPGKCDEEEENLLSGLTDMLGGGDSDSEGGGGLFSGLGDMLGGGKSDSEGDSKSEGGLGGLFGGLFGGGEEEENEGEITEADSHCQISLSLFAFALIFATL